MLFIIYATKLIQTFLFGVVFVVAVVLVVIPCSIKAAFLVGFGSEFLWSQFCEVKTEINPEVPTKGECIFNRTLSIILLSSVRHNNAFETFWKVLPFFAIWNQKLLV